MNILNKKTITIATASLLCFAAIQPCLGKPPKGGADHMQRGIELAQQKQYDAAIAEFAKAIEANPKDPHGYTNRGTAYRQAARAAEAAGDAAGAATRYTAALADFSKLIELAPKDASGYLERGQTESIMKQYDAALADLWLLPDPRCAPRRLPVRLEQGRVRAAHPRQPRGLPRAVRARPDRRHLSAGDLVWPGSSRRRRSDRDQDDPRRRDPQ